MSDRGEADPLGASLIEDQRLQAERRLQPLERGFDVAIGE
jgi:hypothetical protein